MAFDRVSQTGLKSSMIRLCAPAEKCRRSIDEKMIIYITDEKLVATVKEELVEKTKLVATAFEIKVIPAIPKNEAGKTLYSKLEIINQKS
jgi:acyl-coenzyme A synthetase/AMP-(fatty) acid ligase